MDKFIILFRLFWKYFKKQDIYNKIRELNGDPEHKKYVDHRNHIRDDNRLENLRWCSQQNNCFKTCYNRLKLIEFLY